MLLETRAVVQIALLFWLLAYIAILWGGAFAFIIALASLGGRRLPLLLAVRQRLTGKFGGLVHGLNPYSPG